MLDLFAGSCTTADAVMDINRIDCKTRKHIMVQMPEACGDKSEAYKAGYKTIADIGKERIWRVIRNIEKQKEGKLDLVENKQDLGLKVFKLQKSNFKIWYNYVIENGEDLARQLDSFKYPVEDDSNTENISAD